MLPDLTYHPTWALSAILVIRAFLNSEYGAFKGQPAINYVLGPWYCVYLIVLDGSLKKKSNRHSTNLEVKP